MSANRTRETTTTTGTGGSITLNGAVAGHASFNEYYAGNATNVQYTIEEGDDYEVGIGSFTAPNIFTRLTAYEKKEGGVYTKSPGTFLSLLGGAEIFVGIPKEEIDDKASLTNDNTFTGENTAAGFIKSAVSKIVASSANVVDVKVYDTRLDTDNGAWRKKVQWTSWYNETLNTATRGATREFPEVAIIAAETNKVTIYDAADPDVPMWMVFNGGSVASFNTTEMIPCDNGTQKNKSVDVFDGIIVVSNDVRYRKVSFTGDVGYLTSSNRIRKYRGNISQRNDSLGHSIYLNSPIVNDVVNDVSLTTLNVAETDKNNYGLPYQSTIVGTAAGGSLINHDGSAANENIAIDFTGAVNIVSVGIGADGFCILAASDKVYIYESAPTSDIALASADYTFDTAGTSGPHISGVITSVVIESSDGSGNASFSVGSDEGVFSVDYVSGGAGSVVSQIRNDWQSGSQPDAIIGAWLANSKTIDRSVQANTLTENGTVTLAAASTGSEVEAASGFTAANNLTAASNTDWDTIGNGALSAIIWFKSAGNTTVETLLSIANVGNTVRYNVTMDTDGTIDFTVDGASASVTLSSTTAYDDGQWHCVQVIRASNVSHVLRIDNITIATSSTDTGSITDTGNLPLAIGVDADGSSNPATTMSLSLVRLTAYAVTEAQSLKIYNDERRLLQTNALAFLQGASNGVQGLSYDADTEKLDVATTDGTTTIAGLLPIDYVDSTGVGTSDNHKSVSRVDDQLAIGTAAETVFTKPTERL